jgi:NADH dehydrogenase
MKKVLIIGCGYGGVVSAWRLSQHRNKVETTVIDRGKNFNFLPLLPDSLGRKLPVQALSYPIERLASIFKFHFINSEAQSLNLEKREVITSQGPIAYDYLIIASGSETNFYGDEMLKKYAYKLDDAMDAEKLKKAIEGGGFDSYIIGGGGYTGIEVATNLRVHLNRVRKNNRIIIVERAPVILGPLPEWMKEYVLGNLKLLTIEVLTNTVIEKIEERKVIISGEGEFKNAMLIWAAGVKTADFLQNLGVAKNRQGRLEVDEYLRINNSCFAIGDASYFSYKGNFLRMAVQFAIAQGSLAVFNIIKTISGGKLIKYKPLDLGYIIPMANNRSCGNVLGIDMKGFSATACHYIMSLYRTYGFKNKSGMIKALIKGGA